MTIYDLFQNIGNFFKRQEKAQYRDFYTTTYRYKDIEPTDYDFKTQIQYYRSIVYIAAHRNAVTVAQSPLRLYVARKTTGRNTHKVSRETKDYLYKQADLKSYLRKSDDVEEVEQHPFLDLMKNVNKHLNEFELKEKTQGFLEVTGNAYWYFVDNNLKVPQEIWIVPPQYMNILSDSQKFIKGYMYKKGMREIFFKEEEIVHFSMPSLDDNFYGMSPLQAIASAAVINKQMNEYEATLFKNMGTIEGFFAPKETMGEHTYERALKEFQTKVTGHQNIGKRPFLNYDLDYKHIGFSPKELNYLLGRKVVREEIINAYDQTMALYESSSNRATSENATYLHMRDGIKPRLTRIQQKINEKIMPKYQDNLFVAFDNPVPEDKEYRLKEIETHLKNAYSNINEERQIDGKDEVDWGEIPIIAFGMQPLGEGGGQLPLEELSQKVAQRVRDKLNAD